MELAKRAAGRAELLLNTKDALSRKQALRCVERYAGLGATWFEQLVSPHNLEDLRWLRDHAPAMLEIAGGAHCDTPDDVRHMLQAGAVDVQQVDASRCGGISGFLAAAALTDAWGIEISGLSAPSLLLHAACAVPGLRHLEWHHEHARVETLVFDGAPHVQAGAIRPDLSRPGLGLELKIEDVERYELR
jgi:L-alanine-DL-glutamate epimerase-like enolase superfamily enzyme